MGVDIHMHIYKDGEILEKDIFDGRNSEWFSNMQREGWDNEYDHLPTHYDFPEGFPKDLVEKYTKENGYYGQYHIKVEDFIEWFHKYRPDLNAGWATTYEKWQYEKKGEIPEDLPITLPPDANINDMHFIEYENIWDCSRWLVEFLIDHEIPNDAYICYCFDH